jgi:uncharacterized protein YbbC (DUF1343 family)
MKLGTDVLFERDLLRGRTIGLVSNPASVNAALDHTADRAEAHGLHLGALFGPQHGFRSDLQENMIESPHGTDAHRRVPIYSLYSETRQPTAAMLAGLDALVIDLQDVGTRIYTYIYTMAACLRAGRAHGLPIVVCDRPNPLGGEVLEGPVLDPAYASFVGEFPIPMRHGMTIGELARLFNEQFGIGAKLEVIQMQGWTRDQYFDATDLSWVLPSPNLPTLDSAIVYPGTVLFEGTNVSEGRGTTRPFEIVGAPWIDPEPFARGLNARALPGVRFRPVLFEPTFHKHAHLPCGGVQIHVIDRRLFRPVETGLVLIEACRQADPSAFRWRDPPYEYESIRPPIDILCGSSRERTGLDAGVAARTLATAWTAETADFDRLRRPFLAY